MTDSSRKGTSKFMSQNMSQEMLGGSEMHVQSMVTLDGAGNPVNRADPYMPVVVKPRVKTD